MLENEIKSLYQKIHFCHICPEMDNEKMLRNVNAVDSSIDTLIISQALARDQLRRSGVNFFTAEGKLGNTGKRLERFLNEFDRTVFPPREIELVSGKRIPGSLPPFVSVYNTEITQCYPGKAATRGDRVPNVEEINNCLGRGFLNREIELIQPNLILLMGDKSRRTFYKYYLKEPREDTLSDHISAIEEANKLPTFSFGSETIHILPIHHASGANPHFNKMRFNERLISKIKNVLGQS